MTDPATEPATDQDPQDAPISLRSRLVALLDGYDTAVRGSDDAQLAAFVRASLSARDALELRVKRQVRHQRVSRDPAPWERPVVGRDARPPVSITPLYGDDPRPDATDRLARAVIARHGGERRLATDIEMQAAAVRHCGGVA